MDEYKTLGSVEAVKDPATRARAATEYLGRIETFQKQAVKVRHEAIREVLAGGVGPTETAKRCGVSVSLVKQVRREQP